MKPSVLILILVLLMSCKKDKLSGDFEMFIGSWEWEETFHYFGACDSVQAFVKLDPQTENTHYSIVFEEKGKIFFYENTELLQKGRIVFSEYTESADSLFSFEIFIDNDENDKFNGWIQGDTIINNLFPFGDGTFCDYKVNYLIRN